MEEVLAQRCSLFEREPTPSLLPTPWMPPVPWPPSTAGALRVSMETRRAARTSRLCHNSLWRRRQSSVERQKLVTHGYAQCGRCPRMPSDTCCDACEQSQSGKRLTYRLMSSIELSADFHRVNTCHGVHRSTCLFVLFFAAPTHSHLSQDTRHKVIFNMSKTTHTYIYI